MALTPAIFLDKDGTLLKDVPYNVDPGKMLFAPGVRQGMGYLAGLQVPVIVISNQPGIALRKFDHQALSRMRDHLYSMMESVGVRLTGFYYCPHVPAAESGGGNLACMCRKPRPGMLFQAARHHDIDLRRSWMVGDILDDVEAGRRAGCRTILIDNGNETRWHLNAWRMPDVRVPDMGAACRLLASRMAFAHKETP